ncbi:maltose O-acetyltransferase [Phlyctema vagabunda]|uniref:Maltose O-acetyltransferase n=1 Tax=Phlyctema vagabunda TaxID=108571 RepID=A0ABR4P7W1_9HELO
MALNKNCAVQIPKGEEYQKMISGKPFLPHTCPELQEAKLRTRRLLAEYNDPKIGINETLQDIKVKRKRLATQFFRRIGESNIEAPLFISYGFNITIGSNCYANMGLKIFDSGIVTIGDFVWIAPDVSIHTDSHAVDPVERREKSILFAKPVTIESDCWIGAAVRIMPGVRIGRGCTIGAGAVVTKDIPAYSLAVAVPAKVVRSLKGDGSDRSRGGSCEASKEKGKPE